MDNKKYKLLSIDDDSIILEYIDSVLEDHNFIVYKAINEEKAFKFLNNEKVDIILLDLHLGRVSGFEICKKIKEVKEFSEIPIIFLSGISKTKEKVKAFKAGAVDYIEKPFEEEELLIRIKTQIEIQQNRKNLLRANRKLTKIKKALETSETKYRNLTENLHEIIYEISTAGKLNYISPNVYDILGYSTKELKERNLKDLIFIDDKGSFEKILLSINSTTDFVSEFRILTANNELFWVKTFPKKIYENNKIIGLQGALIDINSIKKAEIRLKSNTNYFRSILNELHEELMVIGKDYTILDVNEQLINSVGLSRSEIIGKKCYKISHNYDLPCNQMGETCKLKSVFKTETPQANLHQHTNANKNKRWVDLIMSPLRNENGKVEAVIETSRDITELMTVQGQLQKSENRYKGIVENMLFGIIISIDNQIVFINKSTQNLFKVSNKTRLLHTNITDLLVQNDVQKYEKALKNKEASKQILRFVSVEADLIIAEVNNRIIDFYGADANMLMIKDITTEHRIQKLLEETNLLNKKIIETSPIGISIYKYTGECIIANKSITDIIGGTQNQVSSQNFHDIKSWKKSGLYKAVLKALETNEKKHFTLNISSSFKKNLIIDIHLIPVYISSVQHLLIMINDITKQKEEERKIVAASNILNKSNIVAFTWENKPGWPVKYVSHNVTRILGYTADDFTTKKIYYGDLIYPEDKAIIEKEVKEAIQNKSIKELNHTPYRIITKNGKEIIIKEWSALERDNNGNITEFKGIISDITESIKRKNEITKLSTAVEQSSVMVVITNTKGEIEYFNPAFSKKTGYKKEDAIGKKASLLKSGLQSDDIYSELWITILNGGTWRGQFQNMKKNGEIFWEMASISPIINAHGETINYIKIAEDISKQKETEAELHKYREELELLVEKRTKEVTYTQNKFKAIFDQAAVGVVIVNTENGNYEEFNNKFCSITGFTRDDIKSLNFTHITHPDDLEKDNNFIKALHAGEIAEFSLEKRYIRKDKKIIWVSLSVSKLSQIDNKNYIIGIIQEITESKRAKDVLQASLEREKEMNEMKSRFVAVASHEFRTPLAAINFASSFIKKYWNKITEEDREKKFLKIENQVKHMTKLLNDVLLYGKAESGNLQSKVKRMTFDEFFTPILNDVRTSFKNSHEINITKNKENIILKIDKQLGRNIFQNLFSNAIKFSPNQTRIDFNIEDKKNKTIFKITDYGIGIKPDEIDKVFIPFNRGENTETIQGTGLGLSIVKESVKALNGEISVESKINEQTTFSVILRK